MTTKIEKKIPNIRACLFSERFQDKPLSIRFAVDVDSGCMNPRRRDTCGNQTDPVPRFLTSFSSVIPSTCFNDFRNRHHGMTRTPRSVASPPVISVADFPALPHPRVPRAVFAYLHHAPQADVTLPQNCP